MAYKHLLVHLDAGPQAEARLDLGIALAQRFGARLTGLFAQSETSGPSLVARRASTHLRQSMEAVRAQFEARTGAAGIDREWWQLEHGEYSHVIGETVICARYADLAIFGQYHSDSARVPEDLVEQVLLHSGRPVLVVPHVGTYRDPGRRVIVAWNGSREAARAVNDALPLMQGAEAVTVLALQYPGQGGNPGPVPRVDLTAHLACHGIQARYERLVIDQIGVMDMVLNRSFEDRATLLVMGGHGHYGFPFLQRGGNTRHILRNMTLPVLLSH